ncbi:related to Putative metallocarboxypeptidase ECM14 [Ramularia collo-cygni]|uniref:Inactive metallocarboxypeptidase ECM14 n=1 Tax=Ramularia collo-cygni TaxID=112498 RepID=A0A2D3VD83_9PEZI|nr:related to Putative metallocarboxypeptidase ECM14 [Ramularia collo-cygni]CZT20744.1 related to Putative metallocarboxypeptidase ECM14 [Ramularia collo-cygni]
MKTRTALALFCALVAAVPSHSTAPYPLHHPEPISLAPPSFSDRVLQTLVGFSKSIGGGRNRNAQSRNVEPPASHTWAKYGGDLVLRFNVSAASELRSLAEAADTLLLDVWQFSHNYVDIRLSQDDVPLLLGLLPKSLQHLPLLREHELAKAIHENYERHHQRASSPHFTTNRPLFGPNVEQTTSGAEINIFFADYQPFTVIEPWLRLLASLFTTHVRHINIGLSSEGRPIPALRVGVHPTDSTDPDRPKRKTILVMGSLHAREWISTTTVNYVAYSLITGYGKIPSITKLLHDFDFVFIPTLNPDGYVYTWETDRLWRKNRQQTGIRFCQGIDLDRAFGVQWAASDNPCSESYSGEAPFEAVEATALASWAKNETEKNNVEFVGFLDLHSYSQSIMYPYSYSCDASPPGLENLEELATGLSKAIRNTHGHNYEVMQACEGNLAANGEVLPSVESTGGSALDYFYTAMSTRYAYQIKLRDRGTYGFLLPKENIIPTGKEILNAVLYFGEFLSDLRSAGIENGEEDGKNVNVEGEGEIQMSKEVEDDMEPWVVIEDVGEGESWKVDLRRRRKR